MRGCFFYISFYLEIVSLFLLCFDILLAGTEIRWLHASLLQCDGHTHADSGLGISWSQSIPSRSVRYFQGQSMINQRVCSNVVFHLAFLMSCNCALLAALATRQQSFHGAKQAYFVFLKYKDVI